MSFKPGWKMTIVVIALFPILIFLALWQMERADEKRQILSKEQKLRNSEPARLNQGGLENYQPIVLVGRYLSERHFLLDNQVVAGKVGFDVLTPFEDEVGRIVFVNRGWVKGSADRSKLPLIATPKHRTVVSGAVGRNLGEPFLLQAQHVTQTWPNVIQAIDLPLMSQALAFETVDFFVRLDAGAEGAFATHYQAVNVSPAKHIGYAVQWFAMALALLVLYLYYGFSKNERFKKENV